MGNLLCIKICSAKKSDTIIGPDITYQTFRKYSAVRAFYEDQGFRGTTANFVKYVLIKCGVLTFSNFCCRV